MWAHSRNDAGARHRLVDHLVGTGELARGFASEFGVGDVGAFLGQAHDVGKASCAWQDGLLRAEATGGPVRADGKSVDHKTLGVLLAERRGASWVGPALHGHHGGLTSPAAVDSAVAKLGDDFDRRGREKAERALAPLLPGLFDGPDVPLPVAFRPVGRRPTGNELMDVEMLVRLLYSCLVDADALDTQAHTRSTGPRLAPAADLAALWERFGQRRRELLAGRTRSEVDRWRDEVYEACLDAAAGPTGIYRLPAPTGSGKTLAAAAFALRHAAEHGKRRVVVAVPFVTITEQNAAVYRRLLDPRTDADGPPVVLEHHTNVAVDEPGGGRDDRWRRLAAENWDAPFVVTTTVQLFESLFGRKPARSRKVHRLANAVVVLDEVQALPAPLLVPITDALRSLSEKFGTTVLLASATQPELFDLNPLRDTSPREIVADPARLYRDLRRVRYQWWTDPKPTYAAVADRVSAPLATGGDQVLAVVNTVADARTLRELLVDRAEPETTVLHLSTAMCPAHRRHVLAGARAKLAEGQSLRLVSTQLIEAGVDVDFPVVYRAFAPADSLQQAAGRANREGNLGYEGGLVVVFDPEDGGSPGAYTLPVSITSEVMGDGKADPDDLGALRLFYRQYLTDKTVVGEQSRGWHVQANRRGRDFQSVADGPLRVAGGSDGRDARDGRKAFKMIDDDTLPVVVTGYRDAEDDVHEMVKRLRTSPELDVGLLRGLQPYLVSVRRKVRESGAVAALCRPVLGDLVEWVGDYDDAGVVLEPSAADFYV